MSNDDLLSIGSFALLSGLSIPALRYYDEVGVLKPADIDRRTGYRRYHRDQVRLARMIRALRAIDLPIDEIRDVLDAPDEPYVRAVLVQHRERLREKSHVLSEMVCALDGYIERGVAMPEVTGCRIVELNVGVRDLKESIDFYEEVFDVKFVEDKHGDGPVHFHGQFGTYPSDQFFLLTLKEREGSADFGLLVDDLDGVYKRALTAGATDEFAPRDIAGMPRIARVQDPSGNSINFYQA